MPADRTAVGACPTSARRRGLQRRRVEMWKAIAGAEAEVCLDGHQGPADGNGRAPRGVRCWRGALPGLHHQVGSLAWPCRSLRSFPWLGDAPLNIAPCAELTSIFSRCWEVARPSPGSQRSHRCLYLVLALGTLIGPPPAMSEETQEGRR